MNGVSNCSGYDINWTILWNTWRKKGMVAAALELLEKYPEKLNIFMEVNVLKLCDK